MKEVEKNEQLENPAVKETPESAKEAESKKAQFGNSLDSFSSTGTARRQEGTATRTENIENKTDGEKVAEVKSKPETPEEKKERLGEKLDKLSATGTEKENINTTETDEIPELSESLKAFEPSNWEKLSDLEKEQAVEKLRDSIAEELGIQEKPEVSFYYNEDKSECGYYDNEENRIRINRNGLDDSIELVDTVAHEMRHCWQCERAANPQTERDWEFKENIDNYISDKENVQKYLDQPIEKDARLYAYSVVIQTPGYNGEKD